jgi:hypothetical protein
MKLRKEIEALLDTPAFVGEKITLRDTLRAMARVLDGQDADDIRRQSGQPLDIRLLAVEAADNLLECDNL